MKMRHVLCVLLCNVLSSAIFANGGLPKAQSQDNIYRLKSALPVALSVEELASYFSDPRVMQEIAVHPTTPIDAAHPTSPIKKRKLTQEAHPTTPIEEAHPTTPIEEVFLLSSHSYKMNRAAVCLAVLRRCSVVSQRL